MAPTDRCTMGRGSPPSAPSHAPTEGRPSTRRRSAVLRRNSVDSLDRRPLERTAPAVWQPEHVLAPAATVGSQWRVVGSVAGVAGPIE